ncbi:MAG: hypothetical protein M1344_02605 [Candidatus Thermoplasmatota archaeon]|jgi:hypothetical protein|nr:hypothetical protein [Candidatus Thermoplasmatota archaeon]
MKNHGCIVAIGGEMEVPNNNSMNQKYKDSKPVLGGLGAGGFIGAIIAGPAGALVGGIIGGLIGLAAS